ncbi:MAG: potassium transporter TrkA [Acidimicrobiales bacterium]|nr:MAG: potassium transporter TrkA [Acidimicrobiales bacterium]
MRIAIAGAGNVGRSIAGELLDHGHEVMILEQNLAQMRAQLVPGARWVLADACEMSALEDARLETYDVMVTATGDDKANLVAAFLAKTEFAITRVVARVNRAENEWLFTPAWGVDVAVSKPRLLAALVEEAVSVGDVVRLMTLRRGQANLVEITLRPDTSFAGTAVRDVSLPRDTTLVAIVRGPRVITPSPDEPLEPSDELMFLCAPEFEDALHEALS